MLFTQGVESGLRSWLFAWLFLRLLVQALYRQGSLPPTQQPLPGARPPRARSGGVRARVQAVQGSQGRAQYPLFGHDFGSGTARFFGVVDALERFQEALVCILSPLRVG